MRCRPAVATLILAAAPPLAAQAPDPARIDAIFAAFTQPGTPGCALGLARNGQVVLQRAWGLADLETGVPITPLTIMEAGSVSKQVTAGALFLLVKDGRLTLDDDVRRWIPELPDYGARITLRNLVNHTSGLRDWGSVSAVAGYPRDSRPIGMAHVLATIARVRDLNFPPGSEYDYSNSNYNLIAMVVERVSGMSFPEFTRRRIFEPLGMSNTTWRDDAARVVPGRAPSYNRGTPWRLAPTVESIYGNCCLTTTVGDLLKWNAALDSEQLGAGLRAEHERRGVLSSGYQISYAGGLFVGQWRGTPFVSHGGATAGYRAYTARFPSQNVSVAVLCNNGTANPEALGDSVATFFLTLEPPTPPTPPTPIAVPAAAIADKGGLYRNLRNMQAQRFQVRDGRLYAESGVELLPQSETEFAAARGGTRVLFVRRADGRYDIRVVTPAQDTVPADWVAEADSSRAAAEAHVGRYYSEEALAEFSIVQDSSGALAAVREQPAARLPLRRSYRDGFQSPIGMVVFDRDPAGRVTGFKLTLGRVRNLRFTRR